MGFYVVQAGSSLQLIDTAGAVQTLTLPSGVTIDAAVKGLFAVLGQQMVFVKAGTVNLWINPATLAVLPMSILPPLSAPTLAAGAGTGLTGAYRGWVQYLIKDLNGTVLNASPLSPQSLSVTLANKDLVYSDLAISPNTSVNCRRVFRTVAGGTIPFQMTDIDDNAATSVTSSLADAALALLPSDPDLGVPPGSVPGTSLSLIAAWKSRLWAISGKQTEVDDIRYTEEDNFWQWPATNSLPAYPKGEDQYGVTGFLPRRDELGIGKRNRILKIVGSSNTDFEVIVVAEGVGVLAPASVVVIRDVAYFLGQDGVYTFGPNGITPISRDKVDPWFLTGDYFDRTYFPQAFGGYNHDTDSYELHLVSAGGSTFDRWVSYDVRRKEWLGPHKTGKFTPTMRAMLTSGTGAFLPTMGSSDGYLYKMNQSGASDQGTAIAIEWISKWFNGNAPDIFHHWGQPTFYVTKQAGTPGPLIVTPRVGNQDASDGAAQNVPQTIDRSKLARFGDGRLLRLAFTHSTDAEDVQLNGFELPFNEIGRR